MWQKNYERTLINHCFVFQAHARWYTSIVSLNPHSNTMGGYLADGEMSSYSWNNLLMSHINDRTRNSKSY